MQENMTTSIVLYGKLDKENYKNLISFYSDSKDIIIESGNNPTHVGVYGQSFKSMKIKEIKKTESKLIKSIEKNEEILALSIYSLPENFGTAAFGYNVYIGLEEVNEGTFMVIATFKEEIYKTVDEDLLIKQLSDYIQVESGQIFELSNLESPQIYASKVNSLESFKTVKVIRNI